MSWSPELPIGELRPWPDAVRVVRGRTGEARRYVPEGGACRWRLEPTDGDDGYDGVWVTSCGWEWDAEGGYDLGRNGVLHCPRCGRAVVA